MVTMAVAAAAEIRHPHQLRNHAHHVAATAAEQGMRRLHDDGIEKVRAGVTSIEEIERMTTSLV